MGYITMSVKFNNLTLLTALYQGRLATFGSQQLMCDLDKMDDVECAIIH